MLEDKPPEARYQWSFAVPDERVMAALATVPRAAFLPADARESAGENRALPIECGQTISQPYIVAVMTDLLHLKRESRVLEVGTGSGYQCAVLATLSNHVYTIEVIEELGIAAQKRLQALDYHGIHYRIGDGARGWPEEAPFDCIIVTCAARELPIELWEQLVNPGGRLVIPIGEQPHNQDLILYRRWSTPTPHTAASPNSTVSPAQPVPEIICPVRFVPLIDG